MVGFKLSYEKPWWERLLPYGIVIAVAGGGVYAVYRWLTDPARYLQEQWKTVYSGYLSKYQSLVEMRDGALTEDDWKLLDIEGKWLEEIEKDMARLGLAMERILQLISVAAIGVIVVSGITAVAKEYAKKQIWTKNPNTSYGYINLIHDTVAVHYANTGFATLATASLISVETRYANFVSPQMQTVVSYWTNLLPTLTGWTLLYANFMITYLQIEMTTIPQMISLAWALFPPL